MLTSPGFGPDIRQAQQTGWGQTQTKSGPPPLTTDTLQDIPYETGSINVQGTQMGDNNFGVNLSLTPTSNYYSPMFGGTPINVDTTVVDGSGGGGSLGSLISQFSAVVNSSSSLGNGRWSYTIEEASVSGGSVATTGNTFSGVYNELEMGNTSSLQSGYNISGGYVVLSGGATSLQIAAVPAGTVVIASIMQDSYGSEVTVFSQQNPFTGSVSGTPFIYGKITGATHDATSTVAKWTYNYTQMTLNTSGAFVATATTGTATNDYEEANTSATHAGLSVNNNRLLDFPGYELQPIPNDRIVAIAVTQYATAGGGTAYKKTFNSPNPVKNSAFPNNWFWAKITGSTSISNGRWLYSFTEQPITTNTATNNTQTISFPPIGAGANSGYAFNEWESANSSSQQGGYTISGGYILNATNYNIGKIPDNTIVRMRVEQVATGDAGTPYNLRYMFNAPNPVVGSCP